MLQPRPCPLADDTVPASFQNATSPMPLIGCVAAISGICCRKCSALMELRVMYSMPDRQLESLVILAASAEPPRTASTKSEVKYFAHAPAPFAAQRCCVVETAGTGTTCGRTTCGEATTAAAHSAVVAHS